MLRSKALWENKKAGFSPAFLHLDTRRVSIFGSDRTTPAEAVVHTDLDGVVVVPEALPGDVSRACRELGLAEIVVLVLGLGRPVRREHVFEAGAARIAVLVVAVVGESDRRAGRGHAEIV